MTNLCNYSCIFCHAEGLDGCTICKNEITIERIKNLAKTAKFLNIKKITLTGGEPFLNNNILNIVKAIKEVYPEVFINLSSNISLPSNKLLLEVSKNINKININFQSYNKNIFEKITKSNFYDIVKSKIMFLSENNKNILISLNFVYTKFNYKTLIDVIEFANKYNFNLKILELVKNAENMDIYKNIKSIDNIISQFTDSNNKNIKQHIFLGKSDERFIFENFTIRLIHSYCNECNKSACIEHGEMRITPNFELKPCLLNDKYNISILEELDSNNIHSIAKKIQLARKFFTDENTTLASVSIIKYKDFLIMVERINKVGIKTLETPGGHIENGETPEEAVIREVKEEANINVKITNKIAIFLNNDSISHYYNCEIINEEELKNNNLIKLIPLNEINKQNITSFAKENLIKLGIYTE